MPTKCQLWEVGRRKKIHVWVWKTSTSFFAERLLMTVWLFIQSPAYCIGNLLQLSLCSHLEIILHNFLWRRKHQLEKKLIIIFLRNVRHIPNAFTSTIQYSIILIEEHMRKTNAFVSFSIFTLYNSLVITYVLSIKFFPYLEWKSKPQNGLKPGNTSEIQALNSHSGTDSMLMFWWQKASKFPNSVCTFQPMEFSSV